MSDTKPPVIYRVSALDFVVEAWAWPFAEARRAEIDAYFADKQREKPALWNGRVLLGRNPVFAGDRFSASYFETDFASFLAWRDWGFPDPSVFNGFGMGALRCADGAFVLGEMGQHTSTAGRIYFPSGTPDLDDIRDGTVDISGSVTRELEEETGLTPGEYKSEPHWHCVFYYLLAPITLVARPDVKRIAWSGLGSELCLDECRDKTRHCRIEIARVAHEVNGG